MKDVAEILENLRIRARSDGALRRQLLASRQSADPLKAFCAAAGEHGFSVSPMELVVYGEESYAAMKRSTNGGGENSPLLEWSDDFYELMMAEMAEMQEQEDIRQ